jgi:hypothetical protein
MRQAIYGTVLYIILIIRPVISLLESIMILHMLVQLPLLIIVGYLWGNLILKNYQCFLTKWNTTGVAGILVVLIVTTYWMIPRTMDEALSTWYIELFKFISLPFVGLLFRDSWYKLQMIGRIFLYLNYISMFGLMAWLYIDSPVQVCNNYLEVEQQTLGWGFLVITAGMVCYIVQITFTDQSKRV